MHIIESDKVFYIDVDGTLALWDEIGDYRLNHKMKQIMIEANVRGQAVVVWSAGGWEWAMRVVKEFELEQYVDLVVSKPSWWCDDLEAHQVLIPATRILP